MKKTQTSIERSLQHTDYPMSRDDPYAVSYLVTQNEDLIVLKSGYVTEPGRAGSTFLIWLD